MDDSSVKSSCPIIRVGEIIQIGMDSAVIGFNGKQISVPIIKVEADVSAGDSVVWSGNLWRRIKPSSTAAQTN